MYTSWCFIYIHSVAGATKANYIPQLVYNFKRGTLGLSLCYPAKFQEKPMDRVYNYYLCTIIMIWSFSMALTEVLKLTHSKPVAEIIMTTLQVIYEAC